ncbi:transposable element Tcb1 transposase [Trichonephila clavipes]|uniref:Transposable element Tcb1 transposase n=1 Tax=Trichonephila clavipes TaxID=2585209 RepID=A0A8X6VIH3_TRICX|nr:transposable element Tcb1 transposase [Trichonephila clavipes]
MLGRRIAALQPLATCLPELWRALLDEWCNIPQDQIDNLILSMPRRCKVITFRWELTDFERVMLVVTRRMRHSLLEIVRKINILRYAMSRVYREYIISGIISHQGAVADSVFLMTKTNNVCAE